MLHRKARRWAPTCHKDSGSPAAFIIKKLGVAERNGQLYIPVAVGNLVGEDLESQARQALENVKQILVAAGSSLEQATAVEVFLTDMGKFVAFNAIYAEYFPAHKPARAAIEVSALPKGGCVEIKCTALVG